MEQTPTQIILSRVDRAAILLSEAKTAGEAKKIADMAKAAEVFAIKQKSKEAQEYAHAVHIDALRLEGQFLKQQPKNTGAVGIAGPGRGNKNALVVNESVLPPTLADQGITWDESSKAQFIAEIAANKPEEFNKIRSGEKTVTQVKREITKERLIKVLPEMPKDVYRVIYADPPWKYGDTRNVEGWEGTAAEDHYPTMSINELCSMPMPKIHDNAVLFMWTTSPLLYECEPVFRTWGFEYKTSFIWDKIKHNMGHYNSVRHEILLLCTRGQCTPDNPKAIDSVQSIERTKHSKKPEEFRNIIDTLYPNGKRIELFARTRANGWDVWGNQV